MDDRQTEIRSGAGLEDSRINKEFLEFLNKWSSPVIMVLAVAALVWAGLRWMEQKRIEKIDLAFGNLQSVMVGGNPSPASLNALAEEFAGIRAVPEIAKLNAVDLYLGAFLSGYEPGAQQAASLTGMPIAESDKLDEGQRQRYLDMAQALALEVVALSEGNEGKALLTMHGLIRAGAVAECRREFDSAKSYYGRSIELAEKKGISSLAVFAQMRSDAIDSYDVDISLPHSDELVALPGEEIFEIPEIPEVSEVVEPEATDSESSETESAVETQEP